MPGAVPFSGEFLAPFIIVSPLNMVKDKNGRGTGSRDVDFDKKMELVVQMKLYHQGKSKYRTVAALAKAIAGVKRAAAYRFVSQYDAGGAASLPVSLFVSTKFKFWPLNIS